MPIKQEKAFIDALGGEGILSQIIEHNAMSNQAKLTKALNDFNIAKINKEKRNNKEEQWSKERTMRGIIEMPTEVALQAEKIYPGFFKDKKIMKEAIKKDPLLQQFLTVPLNSI